MNVQLILIQAGIELAREVISSPITKRVLSKAICKITNGSLCPLMFDVEKGTWKTVSGDHPTLAIHVTDPDGDETTLTCSVEFARIMAKGFAKLVEALDYSRKHQQLSFLSDPEDRGESFSHLGWNLDTPLASLESIEEFIYNDFFGADQEA